MSLEWKKAAGEESVGGNKNKKIRSKSDGAKLRHIGGDDLPVEGSIAGVPLLRLETEEDLSSAFDESNLEAQPLRKQLKSVQCCKYVQKQIGYERFPILKWLPKYEWKRFALKDVMVGVTLGFVIAPKAMAHALLAELPPVYGLYTAFFSTLFYGLLGTSKWLSVGTCALPALLFGDSLINHVGDESKFEAVHAMLTLYIALFTAIMGIFRLDELLRCISPVALAAFTTTAAFLIATSQMKYMLGLHIKSGGFVQTYIAIFSHIGETNIATLIVGLCSVAFLYLSKFLTGKFLRPRGIPDPGAIVLVLSSVGFVALFELDTKYGIDVVGPTVSGLPAPTLPWAEITDPELHGKFVVDAIVIAIINYLLAMAIASEFAERCNEKVNKGQELLAITAVNFLGSWFQTFVAGGSFSGSALIMSYEASSLLHNFVNSLVMLLILVAMTTVIEPLPKATLAAIILVALPRLVDFKRPMRLYRTKIDEFFLWVGTFLVTLFAGTQYGIFAGIGFSLLVIIYRSVSAPVTEVGVLPGTSIYRSLDRFPDAKRVAGIRIFRLDSSINFANAAQFEERLSVALHTQNYDSRRSRRSGRFFKSRGLFKRKGKGKKKTSRSVEDRYSFQKDVYVILSCEAVNTLDTAAIAMLNNFEIKCAKLKIQLKFSGFKAPIRQTLRLVRTSSVTANASEDKAMAAVLNPCNWYLNLNDAVVRSQKELMESVAENTAEETEVVEEMAQQEGETVEITESGEERAWNYSVKDDAEVKDVELTIRDEST